MNKKLMSMILVVMLLCVSVSALAAGSKTTGNLVTTTTTTAETTTIPVTVATTTKAVQEQLDEVSKFVAANGKVVDYFGETAKAEVAALLPAGTDVEKLTMNEMFAVNIDAKAATGTVTQSFLLPSSYKDGQAVVVMMGYTDKNGVKQWKALKAQVVNGKLVVTFPGDVLANVTSDATLAVLSE